MGKKGGERAKESDRNQVAKLGRRVPLRGAAQHRSSIERTQTLGGARSAAGERASHLRFAPYPPFRRPPARLDGTGRRRSARRPTTLAPLAAESVHPPAPPVGRRDGGVGRGRAGTRR